MLQKNAYVKVTNRDNSYVGYRIPELGGLKRRFQAGETKDITVDELRKLAWSDGGKAVIKNHLIVHNEELVAELLGQVEPEYYYDKNDVQELLRNGTEDQLLDALEFGPEGVISLIKDIAVDTKLNDVRKREIIKEQTRFDVDNAIRVNNESGKVEAEAKTRRATPIAAQETAPVAPQRRTAAPAPKYKVTIKEN